MNIKSLITKNKLYPLVLLERSFPRKWRLQLMRVFGYALGVIAAESIVVYTLSPIMVFPAWAYLFSNDVYMGATLFLLGLWGFVVAHECIHLSLSGRQHAIMFHGMNIPVVFDLPSLLILDKARSGNVVRAFCGSPFGRETMLRLGITRDELTQFLTTYEHPRDLDFSSVPEGTVLTPVDLFELILASNPPLREFLFQQGVSEQIALEASQWVESVHRLADTRMRWWSKENLSRVRGIGKQWSYGQTFILDRFSTDITEAVPSSVFSTEGEDVEKIEVVLSRAKEANAFIIGEDRDSLRDIVHAFARRIAEGRVNPALEHKRVLLVHTDNIIASYEDKADIEEALIAMLKEASRAGNIVLVLDRFPSFVRSMHSVGSNALDILDPFLGGKRLQVIALGHTTSFYDLIHNTPQLMTRFERITLKEPGKRNTLGILKHRAAQIEARARVLFTYKAIVALYDAAANYFPHAVMPEKALDLLEEIVPSLPREDGQWYIVRESDILSYVRAKTSIPVGEITKEERGRLTHLEEELHKTVIGQDEAIAVISNAMRRARAGVRSRKKPIGSFLFLGPTGVGKTQTAKALARVFFGSEEEINRLDMSEYKGEDAFGRLIGAFEGSRSGTLVRIMKEKPYSVVLLDEFEKASKEVHDLFLRIFDEGIFSDVHGKHVNVRNAIFIATSNAASDTIWNTVKEGEDLLAAKDSIIEELIHEGEFKPELLNRFDATVLFHPLSREHVRKIADLLLGALVERMRTELGVEIEIADSLKEFIVEKGYDPKFGARPMKRAIAQYVEQYIANAKISGDLNKGGRMTIRQIDVENML